MTNKEFFLHVLNAERPIFRSVLDALPEDKHMHKVHEKSREAGNFAAQLSIQWTAIASIVTKGDPMFNTSNMPSTKSEMLDAFDKGMDEAVSAVMAVSDEEWENGEAAMASMWKAKKFDMAWGFLFDAIHHRGQLSTYLRNMGARVPSVYGGSADVPAA